MKLVRTHGVFYRLAHLLAEEKGIDARDVEVADGVTRFERFERGVFIVLRKKTLSAALSASE